MVNSISAGIGIALLGGSSTTSNVFGVDADLLTSWAKAKAGIGVDLTAASQDPNAPLAPVWQPGISPAAEVLVQRALTNKSFFDVGSKLYSDLGATGDYKRLFALYSGVSTLQALAGYAENTKLSAAEQRIAQTQFARGLTELQAFFASQQFEDIRLAQGDRVDTAQTTLAMPSKQEDYSTGYIHRGGLYDKLAGLDPNAQFTITATSAGGTVRNVAIDLSQMGSVTRSFSNVLSFINGKLSAAGVASRLEASDITPKENKIVVGGRTITSRYTGAKQYALKVDVRASEKIAFSAADASPAFYAVGSTANGTRLIKLEDVGGEGGQPIWYARPGATADPIGSLIASGWYGAGAPYGSTPAGATQKNTNILASEGDTENNFEKALRGAGEAVIKLETPDGRSFSVSTAWRAGDLEAWRARDGESQERAMLDDLAERLTQLMHEQGLAAGVDVWEDDGQLGLSVFSADGLRISGLSIGGKATSLTAVEQPGMVGGLRDGVFARRYESTAVAAADDLFVDNQTFTFTAAGVTQSIVIDGGEDGIDAETLLEKLNAKLAEKGIGAAASFVDDGGALTLRIDSLHEITGVTARLNGESSEGVLQAPGAWANGGLPAASPGQPYGDALRTFGASSSPLLTHPGALEIELEVATATGVKTVSVAITAQERADNPDLGGELSAALKARIDEALNAAGVYVGVSGDLSQWTAAEAAGHRIQSLTINGAAVALEAEAPASGTGGAFAAERSFTSAQAATGVSDDVAALLSDQTVSITFGTVWGPRTVSATLEPGDPRTLESAALRLNEALATQGYDVGVVATALSGGGAGLRAVTGSSHTVRTISEISLGGEAVATTLDPIDAVSHADDPVGALRVAERAARGASVTLTIPADSTFTAPSITSSGWFPGRAFDISVGGGLQVATARAVATGADGAVYVLADLGGDSASSAIKGARDVALLKYDSAGKLAFSQMLGASESAEGFALAVAADGRVAIAGAVEGALSNASAGKGGTDSFVTMFDASGKELWTARRGASADDQVNAIAFAPDGSLIVVGKTSSALGGQVALGAADGYVRGYSAAGAELFTRQFGTGGADAATAIAVQANGSGGYDIFTGGVENNRGIVRAFSYSSSAGFSAGATRDIGYFYNGAINALAVDGGALYVGGQVGADRLTLGAPAAGAVAGQEGFVARLDAGLVSTALDRASYLGSAQDDSVNSIAIVNGQVYAAGVSGGLINGQGVANAASSFLARLGDDGAAEWTRTFNGANGAMTLSGLAVDQSGASVLDVLGLPRGVIAAGDTAALTQRSALRVGDEFKIGVDGRRLTTIRITATDTLASLVAQINRAVSGAGRASIVKENGAERIKIEPLGQKAVRLEPGREGKDALGALGLGQGVIAASAAGRGSLRTYGLGLIAADLRIDTPANITRTKAELSAAISIIRQAYEHLLNPNAKELTAEEKALEERRKKAGAPPEYLTAQLANYQAALSRLTGG